MSRADGTGSRHRPFRGSSTIWNPSAPGRRCARGWSSRSSSATGCISCVPARWCSSRPSSPACRSTSCSAATEPASCAAPRAALRSRCPRGGRVERTQVSLIDFRKSIYTRRVALVPGRAQGESMQRRGSLLLIAGALAVAAAPAAPMVAREPFAKAHVQLMTRSEAKGGQLRLVDVDLWAEGTRLKARVRDSASAGEFWVDGLGSAPLRIVNGRIAEPRPRTLEAGLQLALRASPDPGSSRNDRVAGHPCKIVTEDLKGGIAMTRCIWRGLPLAVEIQGKDFTFNAAATMVEEGQVTVADLQPPPGAPAAPTTLSAGR